MRQLLFTLILLAPCVSMGQQAPPLLSSQQVPTTINMGFVYQSYDDSGSSIREISTPLFVLMPIGRRLQMSIYSTQATVNGDELKALQGFGDTQIQLSYARRLGKNSLVVTLGSNLPSGRRELTQDEFFTSVRMSYNYYNFRVPNLGQGFGLSPGFTLAFPIDQNIVLGIGASYLIKTSFRPLEDLTDAYAPGNEILFIGGIDLRLAPQLTLSGDITYTHYNADHVANLAVYEAGDKISSALQMRILNGNNDLRLSARYRSRAKSSIPADGQLVTEEEQTLPNQFSLRGDYRFSATGRLNLGFSVDHRNFSATSFFKKQKITGFGFMPRLSLSYQTSLAAQFKFITGTLSGFEAGAGLIVQL